MAKVIRCLIYEGTPERLQYWLDHSLEDGASQMLPGLTVKTVYTDIDHTKFGSSIRANGKYEGDAAYNEVKD